jgi:hypothetical protein
VSVYLLCKKVRCLYVKIKPRETREKAMMKSFLEMKSDVKVSKEVARLWERERQYIYIYSPAIQSCLPFLSLPATLRGIRRKQPRMKVPVSLSFHMAPKKFHNTSHMASNTNIWFLLRLAKRPLKSKKIEA